MWKLLLRKTKIENNCGKENIQMGKPSSWCHGHQHRSKQCTSVRRKACWVKHHWGQYTLSLLWNIFCSVNPFGAGSCVVMERRRCLHHFNMAFKFDYITSRQSSSWKVQTMTCSCTLPSYVPYGQSQKNTRSESRGFFIPVISNFTTCVLTPCIFSSTQHNFSSPQISVVLMLLKCREPVLWKQLEASDKLTSETS